MDRSRRFGMAVAGLAALSLVAWVFLAPGPGDDGSSSWRLTASDGTLLCAHDEPCDDDARRSLRAAGTDCLWTGRVALDGSANPAWVGDLEATLYAVAWRGSGPDSSSLEWTLDWDLGGSWWRVLGKDSTVTLPLPCDVEEVTLSFNVSGRSLGGAFQAARTLELAF